MKLNGQAGARDAVPQLMGQAPAQLAQQAEPFRLLHRVLELSELGRHVVDRQAEVAQFVLTAKQRHGAEIALRDLTRSTFQLLNAPAQALTDPKSQRHGRDSDKASQHERRPNRLPKRVLPKAFRVKDVKRLKRYSAGFSPFR